MNVQVRVMMAGVMLVLCGLSVVTAQGVPAQDNPAGGDVKILASFEEGSPFTTGEPVREFPSDRVWPIIRGEVVAEHATAGGRAFYNGGNRWTYGDYMFKCAKQFDMKFRPSWYWNACAGDPYYALDCREDDFAWCNSSPDGDLIPSLHFEQLREGLTDYRALLTLSRLAAERAGTPESKAARKIIDDRMSSFKLGQRDHDELFGVADCERFRATAFDMIDKFNTRR